MTVFEFAGSLLLLVTISAILTRIQAALRRRQRIARRLFESRAEYQDLWREQLRVDLLTHATAAKEQQQVAA